MTTDFACQSEGLPGSRALVTVAGELDLSTSCRLQTALAKADRRTPRSVIVDLSQVTFMDSTALAVLAMEQRGRDEPLHLVVREPQLLRILQVTGYAQVFAIHETLEEALSETGRLCAARAPAD